MTKLVSEEMEIISNTIISSVVKEGLKSCLSVLKEVEFSPNVNELILEQSINNHISYIQKWTSSLSFREIHKSKSTRNVYVQLGFCLNRRRTYHDKVQESDIELKELIKHSDEHIVILGQPGAGKTTSIKYISQLIIWDEDFCIERFNFPIVIRLRELRLSTSGNITKKSLTDCLEGILGLQFKEVQEFEASETFIEKKLIGIIRYLDSLKILIIFDGLDEIGGLNDQRLISQQISKICLGLSESLVVVTSRTADYSFDINNTSIYELSPLNEYKVKEFTEKWLGSKKKSGLLLKEIIKSPFYDTTMRPLTIAHLCAIYEREDRIPEKPKTVYRLIIELLLKEWDMQRGITRETKYSEFEVDRKLDFLSKLAYKLCEDKYRTIFSHSELIHAYTQINFIFKLPVHEAKEVINEIESHSGLVLQAGADLFEFAHKSLQEYLVADCISRMSEIPDGIEFLEKFPNELAICVALSSDPNEYFIYLVFFRLSKYPFSNRFFNIFMDRINLENPDFYETGEIC